MGTEDYRDKNKSIEKRVNNLLSLMTIEEKIGQMLQLPIIEPGMDELLEKCHVGSYLHCTGHKMEELQLRAAKTRLSIPILFGIDAIHGHCFENEGTVFPTQLAISNSWNKQIIRQMAEITAKEVRATGNHWTFSPVLCVARDARWGRVDETFGEDPWLIGELAVEMVRGYQKDGDFSSDDAIAACAKHYVAYGETLGGRDSYETVISKRKLLEQFLPPFKKAVDAGCATLMVGYQVNNGIPCSADDWLLREIAKKEWGLNGFIVTDWDNVDSLHTRQKVAASQKEAAYMALLAGNDMIMTSYSFYQNAIDLVKEGRIPESIIDDSVTRILKLKFRLGLFDNKRFGDPERKKVVLGNPLHWDASLKASRESLVLLKNSGVLPIDPEKVKKIAVLGPNADDVVAQLGDWSFGSMQAHKKDDTFHKDQTITILKGIKERSEKEGIQVTYVKGADTLDPNFQEIARAVETAEDADMVIACIGDTIKLHGETHDRANLDLSGKQQELLEKIHSTGKPMAVIFIASKPLTIPWIKKHASAILVGFNPGAKGGIAIAETLFGDINPSGKLTISFPHHVGQIPVYYNRYPGWHSIIDPEIKEERYIDMPQEPLFVFGEGMGYTTFKYSALNLKTPVLKREEPLKVSVKIKNTGSRIGTEIVQLYINDLYSSVTTPIKQLRGFKRIELQPEQEKIVEFDIPFMELSLVNAKLKRVVESGEFEVMVGASSKNQDLLCATFTVEDGSSEPPVMGNR